MKITPSNPYYKALSLDIFENKIVFSLNVGWGDGHIVVNVLHTANLVYI